MIVRQVLAAEAALLFAVAAGLAAGLLAGQSMAYALYATCTSVAAAGLVTGNRDRAGLFRAGLGVGLVGVALAVAIGLYGGKGIAGGRGLGPGGARGRVAPPPGGRGGDPPDRRGGLRLRHRREAPRARQPEPPGAQGADRPGARDVPPLDPDGHRWSRRRPRRSARTRCWRGCAPTTTTSGRSGTRSTSRRTSAARTGTIDLAPSMSALIVKRHVTDGLELARQWRLPARRRRRDRAAPRDAARRLLLGEGAAGRERRGARAPGAARREPLPVPRAQAADARGGAGDDRRRLRGIGTRARGADRRGAAHARGEADQRDRSARGSSTSAS